ncbi:MAG: RHS repeat-associated core domain-containing protein [Patescibacteria group bacterium]|jgi:RHS repeat-associated protein
MAMIIKLIIHSYDKWGRTTQESKTINNKYYSTSWEYGYNSLPTKITYPGSFKVWYSYNNNNLPETVRYGESAQTIVNSTPLVDDVSYSPLKQMSAIDYHNGTTASNTYDANQAYRLTQKDTVNSLDDVLQDISYNYDNVGNITQLVDSSDNDIAKTLNYAYDDLYRLTSASSTLAVQGSNYLQTYNYDPIGNMTNKSDIGDYEYANANPYQATEINNIAQTYDLNGNLTNDGSLTFNFNRQDRFASTTLDASTTLAMLYDYTGIRTMKQKAFDTIDTQFNLITLLYTDYYPNKLYEENLSSIQGSTSTPSSVEIRHIMLGNQTIANIKRTNYANPVLTLVFSDHLGSSAIVTNSSGVLKTIYDYYPYGGERNTDETYGYATDYRFTGKELDEETNLSYFEQRYLNQDTGRFNRVDPLTFNIAFNNFEDISGYSLASFLANPQKLNTYAYVNNNPIVYIDPFGLDSYVFYDPDDFSSQAGREEQRLTDKYNEPVHLVPISTNEQFADEWSKMDDENSDIDEVTMLFHGGSDHVTINYDANNRVAEYLVIYQDGKTKESKTQGTYLGDLDKKKIGSINLFVCQSGNITSDENLASFLSKNQNTTVYGWDGYMAYTNNFPRPGRLSNVGFWFTHIRPVYGLVKYTPDGIRAPYINSRDYYR